MTDQPERLSRATLDVASGLSLNWGDNWDAEMRSEVIGHLTKVAHALSASEKRAEEVETLASRRLAGNAQLLLWKQQVERERDEARAALGDVFALMDEGYLVRDTSKDHEPGFAMRQLPFVMRLQKASSALPPTTRGK